MSSETFARKFVEMCNQGRNFEVMRTMYAPDIVSVEGNGEATAGQAAVIHKSGPRSSSGFAMRTVRLAAFVGATLFSEK